MLPCCHKVNIWLVFRWDFWARNPKPYIILYYMIIKCPPEYLLLYVTTLVLILLFKTMIPIDCKITNFSLYLLVCFFISSAYCFKRKFIILSRRAHLLIIGISVSQYTLYLLVLNLLRSVINKKNQPL